MTTAMITRPHSHRKPSRWRRVRHACHFPGLRAARAWLARRRAFDTELAELAAPVHGCETIAQAAAAERAFAPPVHRGPLPLLAQQMQVAALTAAIPCWKPVPAAAGPLPAAFDEPPADNFWPAGRPFRDWLRDSVVMAAIKEDSTGEV